MGIAIGLSAALGACGGGSKNEAVYPRPSLPSSVADIAVSTTVAPAPGGAPATTRPKSAGGGSGRSDASAPEAAAPEGLPPAQPGTYRYETSGVSTFALTSLPYPPVSTLTVSSPSGTRQRWTRDLRDASGSGPMSEFSLDFRSDGVYLDDLTLTNSFQGMVNVQNLRPTAPPRLVSTGAGPGARSEFDLRAGDGGIAHATVDVTGNESVAVGGQSVDTVVVRTTIVLPPGQVSGHFELTGWFAPSARVWAKEHFVADASAAGGLFTFHSQYDAVAQALTPS
jgi:hypothetical protein